MPISPSILEQAGRMIRRYTLVELIGQGYFGAVYRTNTYSNPVALKLSEYEKASKDESEILLELQGTPGVPQWLWYGKDFNHYALVMTLGFKDLDAIRRSMPGYRFSVPTLKNILFQVTNILQSIHEKHILHRDMKASNLMITFPDESDGKVTVQVIDFGLALQYADEDGKLNPIPEEPNYSFLNLKHSSPYVMFGDAHSPCDDFIQLTYTLLLLSACGVDEFKKDREELLTYKQALLRDPESALPEDGKWMSKFFEAVSNQTPGTDVDYEEIRDSIKAMPGEGNGLGDLHVIDVDGILQLI